MKLSEEATKYAEAIYRKAFAQAALDGESERRKIRASATFSNPNIAQMSDHFVSLTERLIDARLDSYIQAYNQDDLLIDEEDKCEIIERLRQIITNGILMVTTHSIAPEFRLPGTGELIPNIESYITARFERLLGAAAVDLDLARNQMAMERKNRKTDPPNAHYDIHIEGHNFGAILQGGQNNTQNITIHAEFSAKIQELLNLIDATQELTPVQKLKTSTDIRYVQELSKLEPSNEVQDEAKSRLDGVTSVISLSADLISLGMPIIQILRGFFGG